MTFGQQWFQGRILARGFLLSIFEWPLNFIEWTQKYWGIYWNNWIDSIIWEEFLAFERLFKIIEYWQTSQNDNKNGDHLSNLTQNQFWLNVTSLSSFSWLNAPGQHFVSLCSIFLRNTSQMLIRVRCSHHWTNRSSRKEIIGFTTSWICHHSFQSNEKFGESAAFWLFRWQNGTETMISERKQELKHF